MKSAWLDRSVAFAFVAGALTIFLLTLLGLQQWEMARWEGRVRTQLQASHDRERAITDYLTALRDIETGQRGFLVTNDAAYLQPFNRAMRDVPSRSSAVQRAYDGPSDQSDKASQLLSVGRARIELAVRTVDAAKGGDVQQARAWVIGGTGKALMDQARVLAAQIDQAEFRASRNLLQSGLVKRADRQRRIYLTQAGILISLSALLLVLIRIVRNLRETSRTLRDGARRQEAIFDAASDGMMMLDHQGVIESVNPAAEKIFGYSREKLIGKSNLILFKDPPSPKVSRAYLERLASGNEADNLQRFEGLRGDNSEMEAEVVTTPVSLEDGLHFLAVARDTTARREVERMKDEFVATVSHELRTPLTSVAGSLGLILGGAAGAIPDKASRLVQIAHSNCERLIRLINDMLDIEKIESGKTTLSLRSLGLDEALEQALTSLASLAERESVALRLSPLPANWAVMADPDRFAQIVTNLVSNAIKFTPDAGEVQIFAEEMAGNRFRVSVRDQGPGIDADFQDRIFQKFAQADSTDSRQKGGTGLGLSIVRELVERMDGEVGYLSRASEGSTFYFELPAASGFSEPIARPIQSLGRMDGSAMQVLHVDDDPDTLRLVASAFEGRAEVHSSPSMQEAKASLQRYEFDAIILDIALPDGNGLEIVEFVKAQPHPNVPIVLYTALDSNAGEQVTTFARLTKSKATLGALVETVERAMKESKSA